MSTLVTLSTGRVLEVEGTYEDVRATLAPRQLSETGRRELRQTSGEPIDIATEAVLSVESALTEQTPIGFR